MRGPWWSGGIEYNFGIIGHGPYTSTPVDYAVRTNADGSVSCFVAVDELICRTSYQVEVRLAPDTDSFTTRVLWHNSSGLPVPYYHWMNMAAHVEDDMAQPRRFRRLPRVGQFLRRQKLRARGDRDGFVAEGEPRRFRQRRAVHAP